MSSTSTTFNNNNITNDSCPSLLFTSSSDGPMITDITREAAKDATKVASDNEYYQSLKATLCMFKTKKKLPSSPATSDIIATWDLHITNMEDDDSITALGSLAALSTTKRICPTPITSINSLPSLTSEPPSMKVTIAFQEKDGNVIKMKISSSPEGPVDQQLPWQRSPLPYPPSPS
ncbi:hypothetical protein BJV74DRAFT_891192 [Russula compacta]|nr:hypothetical protein BJV74DRAFT_891192 [Russula compacta]